MISGRVDWLASTVSSSVLPTGIAHVVAPGCGAESPPAVLSTKKPSVPVRLLQSTDDFRLPRDLSNVMVKVLPSLVTMVAAYGNVGPPKPRIAVCRSRALALHS